MSQKSILSFFSKTTSPNKQAATTPAKKPAAASRRQSSEESKNNSEESSDEDVPVMSKKSNRKRRCISSSDEDDENEKPSEKESPKSEPKKQRSSKSSKTPEKVSPKRTPKNSKEKSRKSEEAVKEEVEKEEVEKEEVVKKEVVKKEVVKKEEKKSKNAKKKPSPKSAAKKKQQSSDDEPEVKKKDEKPKVIHSFFVNKSDKSAGKEQIDGNSYNPSKEKYHPINDAFWKHGEKVPYLALAKTFELIEDISGRLKMIKVLANFYRSVIVLSPSDLTACVYLCLNQLAPAYEGMELGVAETSLMKVIAQTTGRSLAQIKADAQETGDLGIVAEQSKNNQRMMFVPAALTISGVFEKLKDIAQMTGHSSTVKKGDRIQSIFVACRHAEARFFIRSLLGKLRIGLAEQSILQALSLACTLTPPNQHEYPPPILTAYRNESDWSNKLGEIALKIKTTYCQCPNYDKIVSVLLADGVDELLEKCPMIPGTPLKPMLAHPTNGIHEVLQRFDGIRFTSEYKYDGERAQIHIAADGTVSIYSRNQENNTSKYPDIISRIESLRKTNEMTSCILDCEAVAWDVTKKQIQPFQVLSTRKRKDATEADIKVQVCVFMFDLLFFNDEPLVTRPLAERRALLHKHFKEVEGEWKFATSLDTSDMDELQCFLEKSVKENCEGLMVKTLERDATYEIAKRSRNWLKLKKDYLSGVGDSLDLVVIGGYKGRGKRAGTYGGFLLACYDPDTEQYQSICKIGTGFSDEDLQTHSDFFKENISKNPKSYYMYDASHEADEWFEPVQVWEVLCADLSLSPVHKAACGIIDPHRGISLRFPRFIRIREDKSVEDSTSAQQVADMYSNQDQIKNQDKSKRDIEEDFY